MRRFLLHGVLFVIPVVIGFGLMDWGISQGLRKSRWKDFAVWNDIIGGAINADLIVQGSSRAFVHFSPEVLDSTLGLSSYNLGVDGYNFHMQLCRYRVYRDHNIRPDYIVQEVGLNTLAHREDLFNYQQFLPYLSNSTIWEATRAYNGLTWADRYLPSFRYSGEDQHIKVGIFELFGLRRYPESYDRGFAAQEKEWDNSFDAFRAANPKGIRTRIDTHSVALWNSYLQEVTSDSIFIVLVYPPEYHEVWPMLLNRDSILHAFEDFAVAHDIPFLNYSQDSMGYDKKLFYNSQHLNHTGAALFSKKVARDIHHLLNKGRN